MSSPWDQYPPATLEFCENLLDGWIRQPANTWSNIGFVIVGIYLWRRAPAIKSWLRIFAVGSFLLGLTSGAYHLTMTFAAQFFDVSSMFLVVGILAVLNMMRLDWVPQRHLYKALIAMQAAAMTAVFIFQGDVGEWIFTAQVFFVALSEFYLMYRDRPELRRYRWWLAGAGTYLAATLIWIMDIKKEWCVADNHWFQGHAAWHLLNAVVIVFLYRFYDEIVHLE